jgi:hypothetical protein
MQLRKLDPNEVYDRALAHPSAAQELDEIELLVYAVKEIETCNLMGGWDSFFTGPCSYLYPHVRLCLTASGDARSLAILDDYVAFHSIRNVPFEPGWIEELGRVSDALRPDWGRLFEEACAERWSRIRVYLKSLGVDSPEPSDLSLDWASN